MNTASSFSQIPYAFSYNGFRSRMFNVLGYSPQAGQSGTTVTIDTLFNNFSWRHDVHIRIVIGHKPIHTEIKSMGGNIPNLWRCTGFVPEFEVHKNSSLHTVDVTIQAVDKRNAILDTITIGHFTYQEHDPSLLEPGFFDVPHTGSAHLSAAQHHTAHSVPPHGLRSRTSPAPLQCQTSTLTPPRPKRKLRRLQESDSGIDCEPVSLILPSKPSLADLGNLSKEEERAGRRLVAFDRKVIGDSIQLSFRRISPEEYTERLFVISCIYHNVTLKDEKTKETLTRERWFTSVEILKLVEYIADGESSSNDKSRNRRNLEFIKPTTVSRAALPQFFQLLMDFPIPKPRGIEKDIKVFPWDSLEAGLKKVMEKYAWFSVSAPSSASTTPPSPVLPEPRLLTNKFHEALQHPAPHYHFSVIPASLASDDDGAHTHTPHNNNNNNNNNNMGQPHPNYVPNMPIDPSWLQHHGDRFGLAVASPFGEAAIPSPSPGPAEFSNNDHTINSFAALPDLDFIASPGHIVCGVDPMLPIM